jgi:16S rRNA (guanine(966)-N(2))-methyltransferase RsmD
MSRIIAGRARGRRLKSLPGQATRPTGGRVRQTLFDILAPRVEGARFLDVFAGGGGVGLEALSRGATRVDLVESSGPAFEVLRHNVRALSDSGGDVQVFRQDARTAVRALADRGRRFDIVYLDPPYASDLYEAVLEDLGRGRLLAEDGLVVAEHFHKRALPETIGGLERTRTVRVGDHCLSFYRRREGAAP